MPTYSHSQIETFLQCKLKYKFKYIDKIRMPVQKTVELFMGDVVHQALKYLYDGVVRGTVFPREFVVKQFDDLWKQQWVADILIVRDKSAADYKDMGRRFVEQFYDLYFPFDHFEIVGLETNDRYVLIDGNNYYVRIDKLGKSSDGTYFVCDYKTNNKLKSDAELTADRQLAMYSLWVRQKYPDAKTVKLVWYFLAHNKKIEIEHSQEALSAIEQRVVDVIKQIGSTRDFPANPTKLCDWCEYKPICPAWNPTANDVRVSAVHTVAQTQTGRVIGESAVSVPMDLSTKPKATTQQKLNFF